MPKGIYKRTPEMYEGRRIFGDKNKNWKGGRSIDKDGYVLLRIHKDDEYFSMAVGNYQKRKNGFMADRYWGYVREHRYVMANKLGRTLEKHEIVHHLNGNRQDNRPENLELLQHQGYHLLVEYQAKRIKQLEQTLLENSIELPL